MSLEPLELVRKVRMTKVRHTWSILIMNELLKNTSMYQYSSVRKSLNNKHGKGNYLILVYFTPNFFRDSYKFINFVFNGIRIIFL